MSILIGADIVPVASNRGLFQDAKTEKLIDKELHALLAEAEYRVFNLEVPLTDTVQPIKKHGPNLIASRSCAKGLKALGIDLLTIANNHIMDQGIQGLDSTIEILSETGISYVGAGDNLEEARKPYFFTVEGKRYGVYACAEHEFSIAEEHKPGANPFDPLESLDHIVQMKDQCDYIIVLYHGGKEHYRYPSPNLQRVCRRLVEKGANLVICQHSHCVGCMEEYQQGTIVYGQGNFLFDYADNEFWNTSLLIELNKDGTIKYIPIKKQSCGARIAFDSEADEILKGFKSRSMDILKPGIVETYYHEFAKNNMSNYIWYFSGKKNSLFFRILNRLSGYRLQEVLARHYKEEIGVALRDYIECEAHRELVLEGLKQR